MKRRVVVTGMGAVTPIGNTVEEFWNGIKQNKVGIAPITKFDTSDHKVKLAAEVKNLDVTEYLDRKQARRMDPFCQYAVIASREAVKDAKLTINEENTDRVGVMIGSGIGGLSTIENEHTRLMEKGPNRVSPLMIPMIIGNMASGNVAIDLNARGKNMCIVTACATGSHCIGEAYRSILNNEADVMIAGGCESSITPLGVAGFTSAQTLNTTECPEEASIPFDKRRSGFVMGEGAGIVILEDLEYAKKRGAHIYGELVGYGATCDAYHITMPATDGSGAGKAMQMAMKEAEIEPEQIDYINAHGTSTKYNDLFETRAIRYAFKDQAYHVPVNSTKSMVGHLLGAAGAVEFITCVKSMEEGYIHPTVGLKEDDEECDLDYVKGEGRKIAIQYALSNSLGFGGHNACLIIKKYEG